MSNKKSACDTPNATSTNQNITNSIISSATEKIKTCEAKNIKSAKGLPDAVSDLDVYQQIVEKIFPGARITFTMQIHMSEYELEQPTEQKKAPVTLDLGNLIDW